jgi:hypothetical protein
MALGGGLVDILDRSKTQVSCTITNVANLCPITEETLPALPDFAIIDGPVRVVVRGGRAMGYGSLVAWDRSIVIPQILSNILGDIRFSVDFNDNASGATLYTAVVPEGVTVDGVADTVPAQPLSTWLQLSSNRGTMIQVMDTSALGGTQANYYEDNSALDESDRGDQRHYGDTGVIIVSPNLSFTYRIAQYYLSGNQPNVGETYAPYLAQPLAVSTRLQVTGTSHKAYLPHIRQDRLPTPTPTCLADAGNWQGQTTERSLPVSFGVTSDCRVTGLSFSVPFQDDVCTINAERDIPIINDRFAHISLQGLFTGTFTSPSDSAGLYRIVACEGITVTTPISGTWNATRR